MDSIIITGMHIHCLPATKLYTNGYVGWYTFSRSVFDSIRTHRFLRDRQEKPAADNEFGADQGIRIPTLGSARTSSQPPLKSAKYEAAAATSSSDDDSSSTSWESVNSSDSEVDNTTEKLANVSLEHGPVPQADDKATVATVPPFKCMHPTCGKEGKLCSNCHRWYSEFKDFEEYKDVQQRSRARTWIEGGCKGELK